MSQRFGDGELAQIIYGAQRYELTWDDVLWAARMVVGESGSDIPDARKVLWAMTQRYTLTRSRYPTFKDFIRAYSQPINPRFASEGGESVRRRRAQHTNRTWDEVPSEVQDLVVQWARAQLSNPIPKGTDFAVPAVASHNRASGLRGADGLRANGFELIHDALNRGPDSRDEHGNVFYSVARSRQWGPGHVTMAFRGQQTTETTPTEEESSTVSTSTSTSTTESSTEEVFERNFAMTSERTEPPNDDYPYFILSSSGGDPQCSSVLSEQEEQTLCKTNQSRFYSQITNLKTQSSLEISETVPVIEIFAEDEQGTIVNLTKEIFSQPSLHNLFADNAAFNEIEGAEFPERALASVESLNLSVQGDDGRSEMVIGRLAIVVSNPSLVNVEHPKGKFIAYMMSLGYNIRIKYGVMCDRSEDDKKQAFQWRERGFYVMRYTIKINDDKTARIEFELGPNEQRLMQQVLIGESIPVEDIGTITNEDINQVLDSITAGGTLSTDQVSEIQRRINAFQDSFNQSIGVPTTPAFRTGRRGTTSSFGSTLHAALLNSQVLDRATQVNPLVVENSVTALNSIQSLLLTRRYEQILNEDAYRYTINGTTINAVNAGPLILKLAKPEIDSIAAWTSMNNMQISSVDSVDFVESDQNVTPRSNVQLIFGNFNAQAGQWANKPISSFPVSIDSVFAQLRMRRNLGQFSSNIDAFINLIQRIINEPENYNVEAEQGDVRHPLQRPMVKYALYPDPSRADNWIFYVYDYWLPAVTFRLIQGFLDEHPSKEEIISKLEENNIPWLEMGTEGNVVKTLDANSVSDETAGSEMMYQANRQSSGVREQEASETPPGVSAEFLAGAHLNPNRILNPRTIIMPLRVRATTLMMSSAMLFTPVYIFFPLSQCSGLYMGQSLTHNITLGSAVSMLDLQLQVTQANVHPRSG